MALIRSRALLAATCSAVLFALSACVGGWVAASPGSGTAGCRTTASRRCGQAGARQGARQVARGQPDGRIGRPRCVDLPACELYHRSDRRYPVVYLLHGYTGTDLSYFGPGGRQLDQIAERVFTNGSAQR